MRTIAILLIVAGAAVAEPLFLINGDGTLYGPFDSGDCKNAPVDRRVPFARAWLPANDRRGCPRWRWDGSRVVKVPLSERHPAPAEWFPFWEEYAKLVASYAATETELEDHPTAKARVLERIASAREKLTALLRAGRQEDEP